MRVYLDHNATALPTPLAQQAAIDWLARDAGNPSSVHSSGRQARAVIETARRAVAASIGGVSNEITFTSGATEAIHLAIASFVTHGDHVVCSAVEHPAVYGALEAIGAMVTLVDADPLGRLSVADFKRAVLPDTRLVIVMAAQNEIGNRYAVADIVSAVEPAPVFCDAVQAYGKMPLDVMGLGCAALAISGHKVGAPSGVGALWFRRGLSLSPALRGGPQERGRRAGTENVVGVVGLGAAAGVIPDRIARFEDITHVRDKIETALLAQLTGVVIHGDIENRLANTLAFRIEEVPGDLVLHALDLEGIEISSGSACSSGGVEPSRTLLSMGLSPDQARGGLRVSLGPESSVGDGERFVDTLVRVVTRIRQSLSK